MDDRIIFYLTNETPLSKLHEKMQAIDGYKISIYHLRGYLEKMIKNKQIIKYSREIFLTYKSFENIPSTF